MFDETNAHYSDSNTTTLTERQPTTEGLTEQATVEPAPQEEAKAATDDFASALESFTTETEEAEGEDHVLKGTVVKLTGTHVVVDIGAKSEGMVPIAEVLDHEGKPKVQAGEAIDVIREKGETEEGYIKLSFLKAQRLRAWDEIEKAYSENQPIQATEIGRAHV